jgi:hypothetical protein
MTQPAILVLSWLNTLSALDLFSLIAVWAASHFASKGGIALYAIFTLPGTFAHEASHFLIAFILGAHPSFPSLTPTKTVSGWQLGSVTCRPSLLKRIPIALAPIMLAPIGLWWAAKHMHSAPQPEYFLHTWIAGTLLISSAPSSQDWWVAAPTILLLTLGWFSLRSL